MKGPFSIAAGRPRISTTRDVPSEIAVFGAGAIGCWVGGRLAAGGANVTLIGRPRVIDELSRGLTVSDLEGDRFTVKVATTTEAAAAARARIVLVTVKSAQTAEAGKSLAPHVSPDTSSACRTACATRPTSRRRWAALPSPAWSRGTSCGAALPRITAARRER